MMRFAVPRILLPAASLPPALSSQRFGKLWSKRAWRPLARSVPEVLEKVFTHAFPISASWKSRRSAASFKSFAGRSGHGAPRPAGHVDLSDEERRTGGRLDTSRVEQSSPIGRRTAKSSPL
ncbi:hypothetical protein GWK47_002725 [Chionoecetes opilio]|uniref:Uncharacterized protein n=1 Tax=Chionoecetes opilio TaxID=41210 RepID=A0A8J4XKY7_CHIOP|nr:hypothetical protein GWK47_002725 [Chionoecetes opilio]